MAHLSNFGLSLVTLILALCIHCITSLTATNYRPVTQSFRSQSLPSRPHYRCSNNNERDTAIHAKIAKRETETEETQSESAEPMRIPIDGLVGGERGLKLFDSPLDTYDPLKDTDDLPGEDGTEEKMNAIMERIDERVKQMKASGEWDEGDNFGKNPLSRQPLYTTMLMQIKACKPFESVDELALTYLLVILTSFLLAGYLLVLKSNLNNFMEWFVGTDVDSDFFNEIMRNISA